MSKSETQEAENRLQVIIEHLLKIQCIHGQIGSDNRRGWEKTIDQQRRALLDHVGNCPGLKPKITDSMLDKAYRGAITSLVKSYPRENFPSLRHLLLRDVLGETLARLLRRR